MLPRLVEWNRTIERARVAVRDGPPKSDADGSVPVEHQVGGERLMLNSGALWRAAEAFENAMLLQPPGGGPAKLAERAQGGCFGLLELPSKRWTQRRV